MGIMTVGADLLPLTFFLVLLFSFSNLIIVGKRLIKTCLKGVVEVDDESHMARSLFFKNISATSTIYLVNDGGFIHEMQITHN